MVDDLKAELDKHSFKFVMDRLLAVKGQIFITNIEKALIEKGFDRNFEHNRNFEHKMFHVEHFGEIKA